MKSHVLQSSLHDVIFLVRLQEKFEIESDQDGPPVG